MKRILTYSACCFAIVAAEPALAATAQDSLNVTANYQPSCTIATVNGVDFGTITSLASDVTEVTAGTINVQCSAGAGYQITTNDGANASGAQKRMVDVGGTNFLNYQIYSDAGHATTWQTSFSANDQTGDGGNNPFQVYGKITGGQTVPTGAYSDTVVFTVNY